MYSVDAEIGQINEKNVMFIQNFVSRGMFWIFEPWLESQITVYCVKTLKSSHYMGVVKHAVNMNVTFTMLV